MVDSFRIHPAIGIARVGNSEKYVISSETMAGRPDPAHQPLTGGLPIRAGTENDPITSADLRDKAGALKRTAARFRIFAYPSLDSPENYPRGDGAEVGIGATVNGKVIKDIVWTVHLANKKANHFQLTEDAAQGIKSYQGGLPPIRNASIDTPDAPQPPNKKKIAILNDPVRRKALFIDPGPRAIAGTSEAEVRFDKPTPASYGTGAGAIVTVADYPKTFPADSFKDLDAPSGPIDTLGELATDEKGRLLVVGGYGRAVGWRVHGQGESLDDSDVNNDQWFDDASDGPVSAVVVFADGTTSPVVGAWVTATDPSYAPQILNVVSLWDDMYDCWVRDRDLNLRPDIYNVANGGYNPAYVPSFNTDLAPIFASPPLQQWVVNLNSTGISAHAGVAGITAGMAAGDTPLADLSILRHPTSASEQTALDQNSQVSPSPVMPLHLGGATEAFLAFRQTQYFFLQRWFQGAQAAGDGPPLGPGEYLDKAQLVNCLGGRFSPGIDLTFVMREASIYHVDWLGAAGPATGPFRITAKPLDYDGAGRAGVPLLTIGYVPAKNVSDELEPGDLSKFMAIPWHTDYNSCATHPPSPDPAFNNQAGPTGVRLFWSWPAQRPVAVYTATDAINALPNPPGNPPGFEQQWSVRGPDTESDLGQNWGRFQHARNMVLEWYKIGTIIQAPQVQRSPSDVVQPPLPQDWYLEVQSLFPDKGQKVWPYPNFKGSPGH